MKELFRKRWVLLIILLLVIAGGYAGSLLIVKHKQKVKLEKQQEVETQAESENSLKSTVNESLQAIKFEDWSKLYSYACPAFKIDINETTFENYWANILSSSSGSITDAAFNSDYLTDKTDAQVKYTFTITTSDSFGINTEVPAQSSWTFIKGNPGQWCEVFDSTNY